MNPKVIEEAGQSVEAVRRFCHGRAFSAYRLVQYCGVEMIGAFDIDPSEVEARVKVAIWEGFNAMWAEHSKRFVLCIWEPWGEPATAPEWERVFAERDLD